MERRVWLKNLVLLNTLVQSEGCVMDILGSYTDEEGHVSVDVSHAPLTSDNENIYQTRRVRY